MADKVSLNEQILEASMDIQQDANNYMQKINKITQLSPDILVMCYFRELWACWNINQLKQQDNNVFSLGV